MKIEAAILLGSLFIIQLIPSECASMNGKLYKVMNKNGEKKGSKSDAMRL